MFRLGSIVMADCAFSRTRFAPHFHQEYSLAVMLRGGLRLGHGGSKHLAAPGQIVVCNPYEVHSGEAVSGGWDYRIFYVPADYFAKLVEGDVADPAVKIAAPLIDDQEMALKLLHAHMIAERESVSLEADCAMADAMGAMLSRHAHHKSHSAAGANCQPAVARAVDYIHSEYAENIRLDDVAEIACLSPYHFLRVFARQTGLTPHAYLVQVRVQAAAEHLRRGKSPLEAACDAGFADVSHLTRTFKRTLGISPGAFGKICRSTQSLEAIHTVSQGVN